MNMYKRTVEGVVQVVHATIWREDNEAATILAIRIEGQTYAATEEATALEAAAADGWVPVS